jgi:PKD domain
MAHTLVCRKVICGIAAIVFTSAHLLAQGFLMVPTTTLSRETVNTSSASAALGGNVSKSPHQSLLYSGNTTDIYAHLMGWFCSTGHISVGYCSDDRKQVRAQVSDMKSRGFAGAILDWHGKGHMTDTVATLLRAEAETQSFKFAITEDVGSLRSFAKTNNCDVTQKVFDDLNHIYTTYELSPAYMRLDERPVVFFFGAEAYFVDWERVRAEVSGNPLFIFRNTGAFTHPAANGAFAWVEKNPLDSYDINKSHLGYFYSTSLKHPERTTVGAAYPGVNDTLAGWTGNKVMQRDCGRTWLSTFAYTGGYYNTTSPLKFMHIATYNDYEEGSQIENGIDNCLKTVAWTTGNTLNWKLEGEGPPESISYFRVFISLDGINLMKLTDIKSTARSLNLLSWPLSSVTKYTFYVKAIGKPSIRNSMSNAVGYRRGNAAPVARIQLSTSSGRVPLTVTASTSASSDPDGNVASSTIDCGDGTILKGPKATHTYQAIDSYMVRAYITDKRGTTATAAQPVSVAPATSGVVIEEPSVGSTVPNYFAVRAYASGSKPITAMKLYVNGTVMLTVHDNRLETHLYLPDGKQTIGINAWDATGAVQSRTISVVTGTGTNLRPTPVLQLSDANPGVGATIRACTAASSDPENLSLGTLVDFGDGTIGAQGMTTYHRYQNPGTYVVRATVTDRRGMAATTSTTVTVH